MNFSPVDAAILSWATRHGLHLYTEYRDEEVRAVEIIDASGARYQIWVEDLSNGRFRAVGWDYKRRRYEYDADAQNFGEALERVYTKVMSWSTP